ncbi:MAG: transketolase C-terminal domain-containing protein, partial [Rikenellaceae bacterium]
AEEGDLLVVGWGGTKGHLQSAVKELQSAGQSVALCHFNFINPLPKNTAEIFAKYKKIVVCELNEGQFANYLRQTLTQFEYLQYNKVEGQPFVVVDVVEALKELL